VDFNSGVSFASSALKRQNFKAFVRDFGDVEYHTMNGTHCLHMINPEKVAPVLCKFIEKQPVGDSKK